MWRPKGWENPFSPAAISVVGNNGKPISHHQVYEAGANAMLKSLQKEGIHIPKGEYTRISKAQPEKQIAHYALPSSSAIAKSGTSGTWVFIPDKEE